jgi:hypothetical protein
MRKNGFIASGTISIIVGAALVGKVIYEKLIRKQNNNSNKYIQSDEEKNRALVLKVKKEGYKIFINTVESYMKNVDVSNHSFENFMEQQWPGDYVIYMDNKNNNETSSLRTYVHWEKMYDEIKKNNKDIEYIMNIGEQGILRGK